MTNRGATFLSSLTPREEQFLVALVASAVPMQQVATLLGTTVQVAKNNAAQLYRKAKVHNREGLMLFCFKHGVVQCPCGGAGTLPVEAIKQASQAVATEVCQVYYVAAPRGKNFVNSKQETIAIMITQQILKTLEALRGQ